MNNLANELRLGNWVFWKGEPVKVTMIGEYGIQSNTADRKINAKFEYDIRPIPLTNKILDSINGVIRIDFSFNYLVEGDYLDNNDFRFSFCKNGYLECAYTGDIGHDGDGASLRHIQYLHQFQNLVFSITGKELTILPRHLKG